MTEEELNTALYKKASDEQKRFTRAISNQPVEEILKSAHEYSVREDILLSLEYDNLSAAQCEALLSQPDTMSALFDAYENGDGHYMQEIRDAIDSCAVRIMQAQHFWDSVPVYLETAKYAREHGELQAYHDSDRANLECRRAIEMAISHNYSDNRLNMACVPQVIDRFGYERALHVLANTVRHMDLDGRYSPSNKAWAKEHGTEHESAGLSCIIHAHPGLVDLFLTHARKEQAREAEKKPSLKEQLKSVPEQPALTNKKPHREAER